MFFTTAYCSVLVWLLWPSRSSEAFHTVDSSLLGSDTGMEEAYNYAEVLS